MGMLPVVHAGLPPGRTVLSRGSRRENPRGSHSFTSLGAAKIRPCVCPRGLASPLAASSKCGRGRPSHVPSLDAHRHAGKPEVNRQPQTQATAPQPETTTLSLADWAGSFPPAFLF